MLTHTQLRAKALSRTEVRRQFDELKDEYSRIPREISMIPLLINIDVPDLDAAIRFYTAAFDFHPARRFGTAGIELTGGSSSIYLLVKHEGSCPTPHSSDSRDYARHWTPVHLDIVVTDIEAATTRAVAAGATLERAAQTSAWGKLALLADPFGNGFCLVEFTGRGYDEIAD